MIIIEEHLNSFCEIVKQGYIYYKEMIEEFPRDYRIKEQINCILRKLTAGFAEQNGRVAEPAAA